MLHPPLAAEPPPLPGWGEPWAELLAEKLKPVVRAEIRAALRADAWKRATNVTDQSTLAHEAGHVVGGLLAGHRIETVRLGPSEREPNNSGMTTFDWAQSPQVDLCPSSPQRRTGSDQ